MVSWAATAPEPVVQLKVVQPHHPQSPRTTSYHPLQLTKVLYLAGSPITRPHWKKYTLFSGAPWYARSTESTTNSIAVDTVSGYSAAVGKTGDHLHNRCIQCHTTPVKFWGTDFHAIF